MTQPGLMVASLNQAEMPSEASEIEVRDSRKLPTPFSSQTGSWNHCQNSATDFLLTVPESHAATWTSCFSCNSFESSPSTMPSNTLSDVSPVSALSLTSRPSQTTLLTPVSDFDTQDIISSPYWNTCSTAVPNIDRRYQHSERLIIPRTDVPEQSPYASNHYTPSTAPSSAQWPPSVCKHCGKIFTGRYGPGNLKRHVQNSHGPVNDWLHQCRLCSRTYHRADALRKHSWKKHRLEESRPNKRRRE